jgi:FkbM family methyltransferase
MGKIRVMVTTRLKAIYFFFTGVVSFPDMFFALFPVFAKTKNGVNVLQPLTTVYGHPFVGYPFHAAWEIIKCNAYHEELIRKNGIVIDAGANMGVFSILAARKHPDATIYAFEPTPSTFAAMKENTKYYPNITAVNCGLGESERDATIVIDPGNHVGNHIGEGGVPVKIRTIDGMNIRVDFIKMDTEGYEAQIITGAKETIKKYKPVIAMSAYHKPNDKTELPALLKSICSGYVCELRHDCDPDLICRCD